MSTTLDFSSRKEYVWYRMYLDALSEADPARMGLRICEAEGILLARQRALGLANDHFEERQALAATLMALGALRSCLRRAYYVKTA